MPQHTPAERRKNRNKTQDELSQEFRRRRREARSGRQGSVLGRASTEEGRRSLVTEAFSGKPLPGGLSTLGFERALQSIRGAISGRDRRRRRQ